MPTAIVLKIRPLRPATLSEEFGRAVHAAVLEWIHASNPTLAAQLHDDSPVRPLVITMLPEREHLPPRTVDPRYCYYLRVVALNNDLATELAQWHSDGFGQRSIGGTVWQIEAIARSPSEHPLADQVSYAALVEAGARAAQAGVRRWTIELLTPTTFRRSGVSIALPSTELIFGSLYDRWNGTAPLPFPDDLRQALQTELAVSRFELQSVAGRGKGGVPQIGAVGLCSFSALDHDRLLWSAAETLLRFGCYSGIGAGTTRGFGLYRLLPNH